jgi:hypothetical protein
MTKALTLLFLPVLCGLDAQEDLLNVRTEGTAAGTNRAAEVQAVENAQLAAIIECLESIASSRDLAPFEPILAHHRDYFESVHVRSGERSEGKTRVEIEARIRQDCLRRDAAKLVFPGLVPAPRVLLLIGERLAGSDAPLPADGPFAEQALAESLGKHGFLLVDASPIHARYSERELLEAAWENVAFAASIGREALADIVISGTSISTADPGNANGNVLANRARVRLRLIRSDNGCVVGELRKESVVRSIDPLTGGRQAIEDASSKLVEDIVVAAVLALLSETPCQDLTVTIEGLAAPGQAEPIVQALHTKLGVTEVQPIHESGAAARFRVSYNGPVEAFIEAITSPAFGPHRLKLRRVVDRDMTLEVVE